MALATTDVSSCRAWDDRTQQQHQQKVEVGLGLATGVLLSTFGVGDEAVEVEPDDFEDVAWRKNFNDESVDLGMVLLAEASQQSHWHRDWHRETCPSTTNTPNLRHWSVHTSHSTKILLKLNCDELQLVHL